MSSTYSKMPALRTNEIVVGSFETPISLQQELLKVGEHGRPSFLTMSVTVTQATPVPGSAELKIVNNSVHLPVVMASRQVRD